MDQSDRIRVVLHGPFVRVATHRNRMFTQQCPGAGCPACPLLAAEDRLKAGDFYAPALIDTTYEPRPAVRRRLFPGWNILTFHLPHRSAEYFGVRFDPATGVVTKGPGRGRVMDRYRDDGSITGMVDCLPRDDASPDGLMPAFDPRPSALVSMLGEGAMKPATNAEMARVRGNFREPDLTAARPAADPLADRWAEIEARVNARFESFLSGPALRAILVANGLVSGTPPVMPTASDLARTLAAGMGMPGDNPLSVGIDPAILKAVQTGKGTMRAVLQEKGCNAADCNRDAAKQQTRKDGVA